MEEPVFFALLDKYLKEEANDSERRLVEEYYNRLDRRGDASLSEDQETKLKELMWRNINNHVDDSSVTDTKHRRARVIRLVSYAVAASMITILAVNLVFNQAPNTAQKNPLVQSSLKDDVEPGGNKAILTLADGSKVNLDDAKIGQIAEQAGADITKAEDGKIVYNIPASYLNDNISNPSYNKIETPKGGRYQINLPDGTKVWLNSGSSLKFPAIFNGNERLVELTGEAYFEVSHNKLKPFKIKTEDQTVEVLGTRFNINGYLNESSIKTTLLEGSVKISSIGTNRAKYLTPGQQSVNTKDGAIRLRKANIGQVTSWKEGKFVFNDMDLESIMHQLERWYDVKVDYSQIPAISYNAHISMGLNLSKVLETLEVAGNIKFKIDGRTIKILENK